MITDLRFACRQLLKSPGFTVLALMTLALGIGLSSAIFSLIDDLFLRGVPYVEQSRIVHLSANANDRDVNEIPLSAPRFMHYREGQTIFSDFAGENFSAFTLTGLGDPVQVFGGRLTWNYYHPGLSLPVLGFMMALSILTGLTMGLYPAVQGSRADLIDGLKEGARGASGSRRQQRFRTLFVGAQVALSVALLAGAALLIASMAFGAETRDILRLVVDLGMRPVVFGLAAGLAAALALGRLIASQLYQTSAHSPLLLTATMAILRLAALVACVIPARRASLVNPVQALRAE